MTELSECGVIVNCYFFGYAEAAYDVLLEKFLQGSGRDVAKHLGFDPLREVFYCNCCILEVSRSCWEGAHYVDTPSREGPDRRY